MKRKTGKVIYCPDCYRDWGENQDFPEIVHCTGCRAVIEELREIKSGRLSGPKPRGKKK